MTRITQSLNLLVTGCATWDRFRPQAETSPSLCPDRPGVKPASYPVDNGIRKADHAYGQPPASSTEVQNAWFFTSAPPYTFTEWCRSTREEFYLIYLFRNYKS